MILPAKTGHLTDDTIIIRFSVPSFGIERINIGEATSIPGLAAAEEALNFHRISGNTVYRLTRTVKQSECF